ncbi:MAG: hypothetical protein HY367_00170 [Candidatus Aenigmarchaeota archaeon]|nr:hypothetical protein [Candidatus Aenigmarchaeota archaeon]
MKPAAWKDVSNRDAWRIREIERFVKPYDYSTREKSIATDDKVCEFFIKQLREAKGKLFNTIQLMFERQMKGLEAFESVRQDVDIFSDEVKVRHCEWRDVKPEWVGKIMEIDLELIRGTQELLAVLHEVYEEALNWKKIRLIDHAAMVYDPDIEKKLVRYARGVRLMVGDLARTFQERDMVCNLKKLEMRRTMERIKRKAGEKI